MSRADEAVTLFKQGFNCSQAVLRVFAGENGLAPELAMKIACGLGAGIGRQGMVCGAVSGAYLAIGLKHGRVRREDLESKDKTYALVREFSRRFKLLHASLNCPDLLGCDLSTPAGSEKADQENLFAALCPKFVQDSVEILEAIL